MFDNKKLAAIVTAAGNGSRMNSKINKPYMDVGGRKILEITLDTVTSIKEIDKIIVVIRKDDEDKIKSLLKKYNKDISYVYGGATREMSSLAGLKALGDDFDLVLTHDGVRPFASRDLFEKVIYALKDYKAVICATKAKDTVKIINKDFTVEKTLDRDFVYNVQTPQAFDRKEVLELFDKFLKSDKKITDDSRLFELFSNKKVKVVEGEYSNIKITTAEDILFAKSFVEYL